MAERIRGEIRAGTFHLSAGANTNEALSEEKHDVSFEMFARRFVERYTKDRGKASWQDDESMVRRLGSFQAIEGRPLGEKPVHRVTEDDLEAVDRMKRLVSSARW